MVQDPADVLCRHRISLSSNVLKTSVPRKPWHFKILEHVWKAFYELLDLHGPSSNPFTARSVTIRLSTMLQRYIRHGLLHNENRLSIKFFNALPITFKQPPPSDRVLLNHQSTDVKKILGSPFTGMVFKHMQPTSLCDLLPFLVRSEIITDQRSKIFEIVSEKYCVPSGSKLLGMTDYPICQLATSLHIRMYLGSTKWPSPDAAIASPQPMTS